MNSIPENQTLEFGYNRFSDLFYYLLAHMPVNCAADVSDPEYARRMAECLGTSPEIPDRLLKYYEEHFDRVAIINFMPLIVSSAEECRNMLACCGQLSEEDLRVFADPLMDICEQASAAFYPWWDRHHAAVAKRAEEVYRYFSLQKERFGSFWSRPGAQTKVLFSYSLRKNGRAFNNGDIQTVYLSFPEDDEDLPGCFFQFLHECTHRLTDPLLNQMIQMADGSHDMAEYQVLVYDEYLIHRLCPDMSRAYRSWIGDEYLNYAHEQLGREGEKRVSALL